MASTLPNDLTNDKSLDNYHYNDENAKKRRSPLQIRFNRHFNNLEKTLHVKFSGNKSKILVIFILCFLFFWLNGSSSYDSSKTTLSSNLNYKSHDDKRFNDELYNLQGKSKWKFWEKDPKIVIILAANEGGGVLRWKNEQEWAIEKLSINNKKAYAKRHGYGLTIKDLTTSKRYSHEYREGWQKADILKQTKREFPNAEWFWWLDLDTLIMEPEKSLEELIFNKLDSIVDRTVDNFNPLKLEADIPFVDYTQDLEFLITQDCGGFNLGSFLMKNSDWTDLLLDVWWDPVAYEQNHMIWEHREQDALESLYACLLYTSRCV